MLFRFSDEVLRVEHQAGTDTHTPNVTPSRSANSARFPIDISLAFPTASSPGASNQPEPKLRQVGFSLVYVGANSS
jgi:hypothetical protein